MAPALQQSGLFRHLGSPKALPAACGVCSVFPRPDGNPVCPLDHAESVSKTLGFFSNTFGWDFIVTLVNQNGGG